MKTKINVIDLDGTLVPYDSFRKFVFHFLRKRSTFIHISILLLLRISRIISASAFKEYIIRTTHKLPAYNHNIIKFTESLHRDLDEQIILQVRKHTDENTINILCSASPVDYVSQIARELNWQYLGSKFDERTLEFYHMYGKNKLSIINKKYPKEKYIYNFAISDSKSDLELLENFNFKVLK